MIKVYYSKKDTKFYTFEQVLDFFRHHLKNVEEIYCEESLSEEDTLRLCQEIADNPGKVNLKILSLPNNNLTINCAERIARILSFNSTITRLDLRHNQLGPDGLNALIQPLLTKNHTLKSLVLENNGLSHKSGKHLSILLRDANIEELDLGGNTIGVRGIKEIAPQVCRTLRALHLAGNSLKTRGVKLLAKSFEGNRNHQLQFLDLTNNQMGPQGMSALSDWLLVHHETQLRRLWLGCNDFGPSCGALWSSIFEYNSTLIEVRLRGNQLGDGGVVALSKGIRNNHSLEVLELGWNQISDVGAVALATAFQTNGALRVVDLSGNQIFQRGSVALAQSLPYNVTLKELNMTDNLMDDESAKAFADSLSERRCVLENLYWDRNPRMSLSGRLMLENSTHFRRNLRQWFTTRLVEKIKNDQVDCLNWMSKKYICDLEIIKLSNILCNFNIHCLTSMYLGGNDITSKGSEALSEWIRSSECCLKRMFLRDTSMGDAGVRAIADALKSNVSLQVLALTRCNITSQGANSLGHSLIENETLYRLNLASNKIGLDGLRAIVAGTRHSKAFVALNAMSNDIEVSRESDLWDLLASSSIEELSLRQNKINDDVIIEFLYSIRQECHFKVLDFAENEITEKGSWIMKKMLNTLDVRLSI